MLTGPPPKFYGTRDILRWDETDFVLGKGRPVLPAVRAPHPGSHAGLLAVAGAGALNCWVALAGLPGVARIRRGARIL